jgi:hypothetical protein
MAVPVTGNIRTCLRQSYGDGFAQSDGCSGHERGFSIQTKTIENAHRLLTPQRLNVRFKLSKWLNGRTPACPAQRSKIAPEKAGAKSLPTIETVLNGIG